MTNVNLACADKSTVVIEGLGKVNRPSSMKLTTPPGENDGGSLFSDGSNTSTAYYTSVHNNEVVILVCKIPGEEGKLWCSTAVSEEK